MNRSARSAIKLVAVAAAALPLMAFACGAQAQDGGVRVSVGDLSRADQAAAFAHRLDVAAKELCWRYPESLQRKAIVAACKDEVRDEAMRQLTPSQRVQFAAYSHSEMASAR